MAIVANQALGLAFVFGGPAASLASRSALRRSRFLENAFCAISCSVIAFSASTWRNALRASRSALVIGLGGSNSPAVFVILTLQPHFYERFGWWSALLHPWSRNVLTSLRDRENQPSHALLRGPP